METYNDVDSPNGKRNKQRGKRAHLVHTLRLSPAANPMFYVFSCSTGRARGLSARLRSHRNIAEPQYESPAKRAKRMKCLEFSLRSSGSLHHGGQDSNTWYLVVVVSWQPVSCSCLSSDFVRHLQAACWATILLKWPAVQASFKLTCKWCLLGTEGGVSAAVQYDENRMTEGILII